IGRRSDREFQSRPISFGYRELHFKNGLSESLALRVGSQGTARTSGQHARQKEIHRAQVWQFVSDHFANAQRLEKLFHARRRQVAAQNRKSFRRASYHPYVRARTFVATSRISNLSQADL